MYARVQFRVKKKENEQERLSIPDEHGKKSVVGAASHASYAEDLMHGAQTGVQKPTFGFNSTPKNDKTQNGQYIKITHLVFCTLILHTSESAAGPAFAPSCKLASAE